MSVGRNVPYPGGFSFVRQVADEQQDGNLAPQIGQLGPVQRALAYVQNAATSADEPSCQELLTRAAKEIEVLKAGAAAVAKAVEHVVSNRGIGHEVMRSTQGFTLAPKPRKGQSMRPEPNTIDSAPIDSESMGITGTARPEGWDDQQRAVERMRYENARRTHEHIQKAGTDEEAQAAPPRQDTGVNQSQNQQNIDQSAFVPMAMRSWKDGGNAPDPARDTPETWDSYPIKGIKPSNVMETRPDESPLMRIAAGEGPADDPNALPQVAPAIMGTRLMPQPSGDAKTFNAQQEPAEVASTTPVVAPAQEQVEQQAQQQPQPATQAREPDQAAPPDPNAPTEPPGQQPEEAARQTSRQQERKRR